MTSGEKNRTGDVPSLDALSVVIGTIYETALDAAAWPAALDAIRASTGGTAAWIAVHYPEQVRSEYQIEVGTNPDWQQRLRENYVAASPFMGVAHHLRAGDVVAVGDVVDYDEFLAGRFYREWAAPQCWPDIIMAVAAKSHERFSWLGICLSDRATPSQKAMVARLLPHLERALRISDLLEDSDTRASDLMAAVDGMASGMILLGTNLVVRGVNAAARRLLGELDGVTLAGERLSFAPHGPPAELAAALAAAQANKAGASILLDRAEGAGRIAAHVLPIARDHAGTAHAVAALFLADPVRARPATDGLVRCPVSPDAVRNTHTAGRARRQKSKGDRGGAGRVAAHGADSPQPVV